MARIAVLYVEGTAEDPNQGCQEGVLDEIVDSASEALDFRSGSVTPQLLAFLAP